MSRRLSPLASEPSHPSSARPPRRPFSLPIACGRRCGGQIQAIRAARSSADARPSSSAGAPPLWVVPDALTFCVAHPPFLSRPRRAVCCQFGTAPAPTPCTPSAVTTALDVARAQAGGSGRCPERRSRSLGEPHRVQVSRARSLSSVPRCGTDALAKRAAGTRSSSRSPAGRRVEARGRNADRVRVSTATLTT